jgi:hypothetical protein
MQHLSHIAKRFMYCIILGNTSWKARPKLCNELDRTSMEWSHFLVIAGRCSGSSAAAAHPSQHLPEQSVTEKSGHRWLRRQDSRVGGRSQSLENSWSQSVSTAWELIPHWHQKKELEHPGWKKMMMVRESTPNVYNIKQKPRNKNDRRQKEPI